MKLTFNFGYKLMAQHMTSAYLAPGSFDQLLTNLREKKSKKL